MFIDITPALIQVAGRGDEFKQVMGSHSYERDYCHTHRSSAQFFFMLKKLFDPDVYSC